jgi:hypothetical protein
MSPVFIANPNKMCPQLDSSSMPGISLNNTQIRTFINIFPPTPTSLPTPLQQNFPMNPIDLRKHNPSTVAAHALYHFYFPHLFALQNQQQTHQIIDRGIKRSNISDGKFNVIYSFIYFLHLKNHYYYKNENQIHHKNVSILLN